MPATVTIKVEGLVEAVERLDKFPGKLQRKWLRKGMTAGSTPMLRAIRRNTPVDTGSLKRSLGRSIKTAKNNPYVLIYFRRGGMTKGKNPKPRDGSHWHLVEFGTVPRFTKAGAYRGVMPATPFVRPAFDAHVVGYFREVSKAISEGIKKDT